MLMFPCPWCDHEIIVAEHAELVAQVRCDDCATTVDLAPMATEPHIGTLPLAA
jgi:ribosomal protein S27E